MPGERAAAGAAADDDDVVTPSLDTIPPDRLRPRVSARRDPRRDRLVRDRRPPRPSGACRSGRAPRARGPCRRSPCAQLLNASTRLLPPVISAAWTPSQAAKAILPCSSTPLTWAMAAPRPIIAIVPLSRYENGLAVLAAPGRRGSSWPPTTPLCSATEPSCGWVLPSLAGMFAMSPMTRTPGNPATVKSGRDVDPAAATLRQPAGAGDRRGHQAAAPDDAAGLDRRRRRTASRARADGLHARCPAEGRRRPSRGSGPRRRGPCRRTS